MAVNSLLWWWPPAMDFVGQGRAKNGMVGGFFSSWILDEINNFVNIQCLCTVLDLTVHQTPTWALFDVTLIFLSEFRVRVNPVSTLPCLTMMDFVMFFGGSSVLL